MYIRSHLDAARSRLVSLASIQRCVMRNFDVGDSSGSSNEIYPCEFTTTCHTESAEFIDRLINHNSKSRKRNGFLCCRLSSSSASPSRRAHQKNKYSLLNKIEGPGRASSICSTHSVDDNSRRAYTQFYFISRCLNAAQHIHTGAAHSLL